MPKRWLLERHDDGLQNADTGLQTHHGNDEVLELEETRRCKVRLASGKGRRFKSDQPHHLNSFLNLYILLKLLLNSKFLNELLSKNRRNESFEK